MDDFNRKYARHRMTSFILEISNNVCIALGLGRRFKYVYYDDDYRFFAVYKTGVKPRPQKNKVVKEKFNEDKTDVSDSDKTNDDNIEKDYFETYDSDNIEDIFEPHDSDGDCNIEKNVFTGGMINYRDDENTDVVFTAGGMVNNRDNENTDDVFNSLSAKDFNDFVNTNTGGNSEKNEVNGSRMHNQENQILSEAGRVTRSRSRKSNKDYAESNKDYAERGVGVSRGKRKAIGDPSQKKKSRKVSGKKPIQKDSDDFIIPESDPQKRESRKEDAEDDIIPKMDRSRIPADVDPSSLRDSSGEPGRMENIPEEDFDASEEKGESSKVGEKRKDSDDDIIPKMDLFRIPAGVYPSSLRDSSGEPGQMETIREEDFDASEDFAKAGPSLSQEYDVDIPERVAKLRKVVFNRFNEMAILCTMFCSIMHFLPSPNKFIRLAELDEKIRLSLLPFHYSITDLLSVPPVTIETIKKLSQMIGTTTWYVLENGTDFSITFENADTHGAETQQLFNSFRNKMMAEDLQGNRMKDLKDRYLRIRYPRNDVTGVEVLYGHLKELEPNQFVGSNLLDFYIRYLLETKFVDERFYIAAPHIYQILESIAIHGSSIKSMQGWFRNEKILHKRFILFPVNVDKSGHWSLIIAWINKDVVLLHLDSLGMHRWLKNPTLFEIFKSSFAQVWNLEKGGAGEESSNFDFKFVEAPCQSAADCGFFVLKYIEEFVTKPPPESVEEFIKLAKIWFHPDEAANLRRFTKDLILEQFRILEGG